MAYEQIRYEVEHRVATVTLNRPERMNSWNEAMSQELSDALYAADGDDGVRAVVITGAGRAFCAGADLTRGGTTFAGREGRSAPERPPLWPWQVSKPVIAAINGHAVGVGITYPLLADVRIVAEDAKIAFAFVRRGVIPELASHVILPRVLGFSRAADLLLSGRTIRGAEAAALGLASVAVPAEQVLPKALELAHDIAESTAPVSVAISKRLLWEGMTASVEQMLGREGRVFTWIGNQPDAREGVVSFVEKRAPRFTMSARSDFPAELVGG